MAKKHVSIVELHVEKVVLGVAVLFLLTVVSMYLVNNPNTVEFDNKELYAGQIDLVVRDQAALLAQKLQRDWEIEADRLTAPEWERTLTDAFEHGPIDVYKLDPTIVRTVLWGPAVQRITVEKTRQAREGVALAEVDPSSAPQVRYMRTLAVPPQEPATGAGEDPDKPADDEYLPEVDVDLVIIESTFDVARQQEALLKDHNYEPDYATVTFADVQVQRQERLGAEWGEWEDVIPFREEPLPSLPAMKFVGDDNVLSRESRDAFVKYSDELRAARVQQEVLIPEGPRRGSGGPAYVEEGDKKPSERMPSARDRRREPGDYAKRRRKPDVKYDTRGYGAEKPKKDKRLRFNSKEEANTFITEALAKAEAAWNAKKYEEAKVHAQQVLEAYEVSKAGRRSQISRAEQILGVGEKPERGGPKQTVDAGEKPEPIRAFDVSGQPGRTYRYRIRVGLLNEYCLKTGKLKDPKDATKPIIYGQWSEPSDPVSIERDTYFYLVGRDARKQGLRIDVFKWYQDGWIREAFTVQPGQEIGARRDVQVKIAGRPYYEEVDFSTGAVAIDVNLRVPYQDVQSQGEGYALSERRSQTQSLVYMDEDGELHQHFAMIDKTDPRYKALVQQTKESRVEVKVQRGKETGKRSGAKGKRPRGSKKFKSKYGGRSPRRGRYGTPR